MMDITPHRTIDMKLHELGKEALKGLGEQLTFSIGNVTTKAAKSGTNVGYRAVTDQGKVVTFWTTTMDDCVEELDAIKGLYQVKAGVTITDDGSLIAPGKGSKGFWS